MQDTVTVAILAKDKAHCLPIFLQCLEAQTWPKAKTHIYIRSNNNNDNTKEVLENWIKRAAGLGYANIFTDFADVEQKVQDYKPHEWNELRFSVLSKIRQASIDYAIEKKSHYMVIDCDNFITSDVIQTMYDSGLTVVAPMLTQIGKLYSNYHSTVDADGYFANDAIYNHIHSRGIKGLIQLPVIHCTYFIRQEVLAQVSYQDETKRHEYVIFSHTLRKKNISQYLDNRRHYGYISMADSMAQLEPELRLMNVPTDTSAASIWQKIYAHNLWGKGSGPGSSPETTIEYRKFLQGFLSEYKVKTVLDIGSGDWQSSQLIDWTGIHYRGIDCVKDVLENVKAKFEVKDQIEFYLMDVLKDINELSEWKVDLIILKDVVQHWPTSDITLTLPKLMQQSKHILLTNSSTYGNVTDIGLGDFRSLNRHKEPLSTFSPKLMLKYSDKEVLLLKGNL